MVIQLSYLEKDVEDIIQSHTSKFLGLNFIARQFNTPVGVIDVIAKSHRCPRLYWVIEIKRDKLDASAYCQALRYSNWLNSEMSKDGSRFFRPLIIGSSLSDDLASLCKYFDGEDQDWWDYGNQKTVMYRLFNFDPISGVSFNWSSPTQRDYEEIFVEGYNHTNAAIERLEMEVYFAAKEHSTALTLVKSEAANG